MAKLKRLSTDIEELRLNGIRFLANELNEALYPADERTQFFYALLAYLIQHEQALEDAVSQYYLRYARGAELDAIGETRTLERLQARRATTVLEFRVNEPKSYNIYIPAGTKVTTDTRLFFATVQNVLLQAGETFVQVEAEATQAGSEYNGIEAGQVRRLVDDIADIDTVRNVEITTGGREEENDDEFRERIRLAPNTWSTAGPAAAYRAWALEAPGVVDAMVLQNSETLNLTLPVYDGYAFFPADRVEEVLYDKTYDVSHENLRFYAPGEETVEVTVKRNLKGQVVILPICKDGELPDSATLQEVYEACTQADRKPLTDYVTVRSPEPVFYDIDLVYYTTQEIESQAVENVEGPDGAIERYLSWQDQTLGQDINPDALRKLILCPDWDEARNAPYRLEITSPVYTEIEQTQIPKCRSIRVRHEVIYG